MSKQTYLIVQLALNVQLSIAKLDPLQETLKLVSELCEMITGVSYPIDLEERRNTRQRNRQQKSNQQNTSLGTKTKSQERITKEQRLARNAEVRKRVDAGEKQTDVAKSMGLSDAIVSQIMKKHSKTRIRGQTNEIIYYTGS